MAAPTAGLEVDLQVPYAQLRREFAGREKQVDKAIVRAIRKTVSWLRRQLIKQVASEAGIPQKAIRQRGKAKTFAKEQYGVVWLGLNPVGAHLIGKPRQTRRGVRVGRKHFFEGAFLSRIYSDNEKVWRRKFRGPGSTSRGRGDGRFPVEVMLIELETIGEQEAKALNNEARVRFLRTMKQEINFAINVEPFK